MNKKNLLLFGVCTSLVIGVSAIVLSVKSPNMRPEVLNAAECSHVGNHYNAKAATCTAAGNQEFWACCKCHEKFLEVQDGTWTNAELENSLEELHPAYVAPDHHFGENGKCTHCSGDMKDIIGLDDGDFKPRMTLSNMNVAVPYNIKDLGGDHLFPSYNIGTNNGLDLYFNFNYEAQPGDCYPYFYLGNGANEDGLIVRMDVDRVDQYNIVYLRTNASGASSRLTNNFANCHLIFKNSTAKPESGKLVNVSLKLVDKATETYHFDMNFSNDGGATWAKRWYAVEGGEEFTGLDYTFGAGYFNGGAHGVLRFSNRNTTSVVLSDASFGSNFISYANEAGTVFGHTEVSVGDEVIVPKMQAAGKTFLGWFDQMGNKYVAYDRAPEYDIKLVARFTETKDVMLQPSNADHAGKTYTSESNFENNNSLSGIKDTDTRVDIYSMISMEKAAAGIDGYFFIGFPYDFVDAATRLCLRIANKVDQPVLQGYIYGASLGDAGEAGTSFNDPNFKMNGNNIMVHTAIELTGARSCNFYIEIVNLGDGYKYTASRMGVTFAVDYSFAVANRTKLCFSRNYNGGSYTVNDIF